MGTDLTFSVRLENADDTHSAITAVTQLYVGDFITIFFEATANKCTYPSNTLILGMEWARDGNGNELHIYPPKTSQ